MGNSSKHGKLFSLPNPSSGASILGYMTITRLNGDIDTSKEWTLAFLPTRPGVLRSTLLTAIVSLVSELDGEVENKRYQQ
jgi:hypothetical protein